MWNSHRLIILAVTTQDDRAVAVGHSVDPARWLGMLNDLMGRTGDVKKGSCTSAGYRRVLRSKRGQKILRPLTEPVKWPLTCTFCRDGGI
jgi:hypothetical protein